MSHERIPFLRFSKGLVSDYINSHLTDNQTETWTNIKLELKLRFAEIKDPQYALSLFKTIKPKTDENVQFYAELLLSLATEGIEQK